MTVPHPLESSAPLIVYFDIKSPYAFVAYRPTLALEAELGLQFDWRPLTLDIPSYLGSAQKKDGEVVASSGRNEKMWRAIRYSYKDARRYAERQGLTLNGTEKIWDSSIANLAFYWVALNHRDRLPAFLHAVYPPFWRRELDIEDLAVVKGLLDSTGVNSTGFEQFESGNGRQVHDALQHSFHPAGIYGVPTYVLEGQVFIGREHIPYLRWALAGRNGPAPDIAYEIAS
ncbi:MAG: DsbA family protein [Pseudomonadota bacterium]